MTDIPEWAVAEAQRRIDAYEGPGNAARNVLAEMIATHEPAPVDPVDPDVLAVREILAAWYGETYSLYNEESDPDFDATLAAYREHASKRNG